MSRALEPGHHAQRCSTVRVGFIVFSLLLFTGFLSAKDSAPAPVKAARLVVQPSAIDLHGAQAEHGLLVTAITADGRTVDVTGSAKLTSKFPKTVVVQPNGVCRALGDGKSEITVSYNGRSEKVTVTAMDTAHRPVPSFRQDVLPVLTKTGCNAGACHGKLAGQNGFKLSLRGYAPEWDFDWLTKEVRSRRIDYARPEESLILQKPLGIVPHEGGTRFAEGSRHYQLLADWISARAPGPLPATNESDAARIEVLPGNRTLRVGDRQRLLVRAHYPDGRVRDVTWLAQFFSNDEATVGVSSAGVVKALRHGEASVRAHFQGQVEVVLFTMPYENKVDPKQFSRTNNVLDAPVFAKLRSLNVPPSSVCDDAGFLRRASLDATGTLPTPEEVRTFLADTRADKRAWLVEDLLRRPEFVDYWTLQLADLLQNRKERDHDVRGTKGVRSFHAWLRGQVAANRPWNELARELLTASGDSVTQPEIGYFITTIGEKKAEESELSDSVAQAFLGARIGCARCHNHPLEKYTQDDYYHFAAFFSRVSLKREEPDKGRTVLSTRTKEEEQKQKEIADLEKKLSEAEADAEKASGDDAEKAKKKLADQRKKMEEARQQLTQMQSRMPGVTQPRTKKFMAPQALDRSEFHLKPGQDVRGDLAVWITDPKNANFSGAMVNRLWKHFFSVGLVEQVDDLRASNPPSNPELWRVLNREFVAHGFDLKNVMRLIMNSRVYQLGSETVAGNETDRKFYSHYYARRLPAEVMLDAVSSATGVAEPFAGYPVGTRAIQLPEPGVSSYFLSLFGRSDRVTACACERKGDVTLPQLLHLQNADNVLKKVRAEDSRLQPLLKEKDDARVAEEIFLSTVGRRATGAEAAALKASLAGAGREEVFADLFWALLNTKEFAFNH